MHVLYRENSQYDKRGALISVLYFFSNISGILQLVFIMSDLQRELWSLCRSFQVLLAVVGLQPWIIPLLGIAITWYKVRETLWMTETI